MGVLGKKWSLFLLRTISIGGRPGFSDLLRSHSRLSRRMLSYRLIELRKEGYVDKIVLHGSRLRTAYMLTQKGQDALPILYAFSDLVRRYGEGVAVTAGRPIPADDVCYSHPDIKAGGRESTDLAALGPQVGYPPRPKPMVYKQACEKCDATLTNNGEAFVCSYECTWCRECAEGFEWRCPNCQRSLTPRIRLESTPGATQA